MLEKSCLRRLGFSKVFVGASESSRSIRRAREAGGLTLQHPKPYVAEQNSRKSPRDNVAGEVHAGDNANDRERHP